MRNAFPLIMLLFLFASRGTAGKKQVFINITKIEFSKTGKISEVLIIADNLITRYSDQYNKEKNLLTIDIDSAFYKVSLKEIKLKDENLRRVSGAQFKVSPIPVARINLYFKNKIDYALLPKGDTLAVIIEKAKEEISIEPLFGSFFFYNSHGKRDPFEPLLTEEEVDTLLNVGSAILVGIIQNGDSSIALLKDVNGTGFVLKKGDPVRGGRVLDIRDNEVVFLLSDYGFSRKVILRLEKNKESKGR